MIKTLFVPTSGSETDNRVFATALALARPLHAHMQFFHMHLSSGEAALRAPHVDFAMGEGLAIALEDLRRKGEELAAKATLHCHDFCKAQSVPMVAAPSNSTEVSASWTQATEGALANLLFHARHSDLTVLGRPRNRDFMPLGLVESLLLGSGRPLVLASDGPPPEALHTIVVGWKETPEASRALAVAMPLLEQARRVILLAVEEEAAASTAALADLAHKLAWHGIAAQVHVAAEKPRSARNHLQKVAIELGADLLVVGGFGHGPFREQVFGGVTQSLVNEAMLPVFMMH